MAVSIDTEIQFLKGVGPRLGSVLKKRGISTVSDLLHYFPRAYEDRRAVRCIADLRIDEIVSIKAIVVSVNSFQMGRARRKMYEVLLRDNSGRIRCKFFRVPYRGYFERFQPNQQVRVVGKVTNYRGNTEFHHPDIHPIEEDVDEDLDQLVPLYTESDGLNSKKMHRIIESALANLVPIGVSLKETKPLGPEKLDQVLIERLPKWIIDKYELAKCADAIRFIHLPPKKAGDEYFRVRSPYHRRIIFEEFFWLELYLATRKKGLKNEPAPEMRKETHVVERFLKQLPFELTGAQTKVFDEIWKDMCSSRPMHRLVQGDVGSGKTVVALLSVVLSAANGYQSAIMVPTEILCEQHYQNAVKFLEPLGLRVGVLNGSVKQKARNELVDDLAKGHIHVVIGTQALIQDGVEFEKLGLVVVDEQHRFGVHQRAHLKNKGKFPHFLVMTATPIPRTLAMTVYGDLDVSIIDELPKGRQPIITRVTYQSKQTQILKFVQDQVARKRQVYIVYPLVEESEKMDLKDATQEFEKMRVELPSLRFGLLHGRMKSSEKEQVMNQFRNHEIDVLVSTTVIEVGVDVPNANLMIIQHAERFGLSQLHQLRGRVGRGTHKSYCVLVLGHAVGEDSKTRTQIMEKYADGFKIAEADLELRGPGEFLGKRQSGLPGFKMANLVRDVSILQDARQAAFEVIRRDPKLISPDHSLLRAELLKAHGSTALASIG